ALPFTAEEAWVARYGAEASVHLEAFEPVPDAWANDALAEGLAQIRALRGDVTGAIEKMRVAKTIGSSLQAKAMLAEGASTFGDETFWAEICITSSAGFGAGSGAEIAPGHKCERCWRVLPEVGADAKHPTLCLRCVEAVEEIA
ncbi:MAG: isoleucine--tRNA ligase, partial [Rhodospirillales bacterium]|nr:isoleucine--tRNA ligase [Rhodospirillales bacterium]